MVMVMALEDSDAEHGHHILSHNFNLNIKVKRHVCVFIMYHVEY